MGNTAITTVIFDFGGVVVDWNMRALFSEFFASDAELDHFLSEVLTPEDNLRCDLGAPIAEVVAELVDKHPSFAEPLEAWRNRWIETIPGIIDGTQDLIAALVAGGYRILGLSNFSAETFPLCIEKYPVFDAFEDILLSGELGIAKPDPAIYLALCERNGIEPGEAIFLDDSPINVEGAHAVGMASFLFTTAEAAATELRSRGLTF